jgi:hypothetical protein
MLRTVQKTTLKTDAKPKQNFDHLDAFEVLNAAGATTGMSAEWAIDYARSNEGRLT